MLLLPSPPARAAGQIAISASPRMLELDPGARATLRITAPEPPVVSVNVGRVESVRALGGGAYEATYLPPAETYPQVAIISAYTSNARGWLALPLAGTGEVAVVTEPNGTATLVIGKERFGPAQADANGRASIRIVVPPGARYAMQGTKRLSLNTPDVSHVYVTLDRATVPADTSAVVHVRAFAVTSEGKPRRGAPLRLSATAGQLSTAREVEAGVFEARWSLAPGSAGAAAVEATLADEPKSTSQAAVQRESSTPRKLQLEVGRRSLVAGDGALEFTIRVEDGAGNPVDEASPRASVSFGTFLGWTHSGPGRWLGRVSIPERLDGTSRVDIVASVGDVVTQRSVPLSAGPTAELSVDPASADLTGKTSATFSVSTVDRFGNPTDDAGVKATATLGAVEAPVRQGVGLYRVVYRPPAETGGTTRDEITIRAGGAQRISRVKLPTPSTPLLSFTPKAGVAARSGGGFGPVAGGEAAIWGQLGGEDFGLALDGRWFMFSQTRSVTPPGATALSLKTTASYVALTAGPAWRHGLGSGVMLWASVAAGMASVQGSSTISGQGQHDDPSKWVPVGAAALSIGARAWGGYPFAELSAAYVADPKIDSSSGSFVPLFLQLGYRFDAF